MKGHFIRGQWRQGVGKSFNSFDSSTQKLCWQGHEASIQEVNEAFASARLAFPSWSSLSLSERIKYIESYRDHLSKKGDILAEMISKEVGKPLWESKTEVTAMINKIGISINAYNLRCPETNLEQPQGNLFTRHRPHGVMAVLGPFNFPGHLPNGHIVPALLAGNTVVFKPSEFAPFCAEIMVECWEQAGLPSGVFNMVQGGRETGKLISQHPEMDGLLFTGSWPTGKLLAEQMAATPHKILALEMGGNNPYVIGDIADLKTAAYLTILSAFITAGQRCTCARRLIVPKGKQGDDFLKTLLEMAKTIRVDKFTASPEPFMGPLISPQAAENVLAKQNALIAKGAQPLLKMEPLKQGPAFLSPGIIDVTPIADRPDEEIFGPLLQVIRVDDLTAAIKEANNTQYGLSAGILSDNPDEFKLFLDNIRAGVINWNAQLTGSSSYAPFGGLKHSGNHRPSGLYAADYCSYPVASLEIPTLQKPKMNIPGINS